MLRIHYLGSRVLVLCIVTCALLLPVQSVQSAEKAKKVPRSIASTVGYLLKQFYYDQDRFDPVTMINRAIRAMEASEMSLEVSWNGRAIRCNFDGDVVVIPATTPLSISDAMGIITTLQGYVEKRTEYSTEQMARITYAMINGAIQTLDPHTVIFPPRPASRFREDLAGEFFGIGAYLNHEDGVVIIDRVMIGNPADRAGILGGDKIVRVDGEKTEGLSLSETVQRIKGPRGTKVVLGVEREGEEKIISITVIRGLVKMQILESYREGDVVYVRLDEFNKNSDTMLRNVLNVWDRDVEHPVLGLVFDMRFNGGGLLSKAQLISGMFLGANKEIVRTVSKEGKPDIKISNQNNLSILDVPMMVLLSPSSASATEIVAGALQQNGRAVIIGSTSYGKGSVQNFRTLNDESLFKYTIQEYQLKDGVSIQGVGIAPDIQLLRQNVDADGNVDVHPFERKREVDGEFALHSHGTYKHNTRYQLPWLAEDEDEGQRRTHYIGANNFKPDQEARLVMELMATALKNEKLDDIMSVDLDNFAEATLLLLKDAIVARADSEEKDLLAALAEHEDIDDWGSKERVDATALSIRYTGPKELQAGQEYEMSFEIENTGAVDCGRLYGVVRRDEKDISSPFWEEEILIGNIKAQTKKSGSFSFHVPPRIHSNAERFSIDLFQSGYVDPVLTQDIDIHVAGAPRPHFDIAWTVKDAPQDIQFDTAYEVEVTIENTGTAVSAPITMLMSKNDNRFIQLSEGRWKLDPLKPGHKHVVVVPFQINRMVKLLTRSVANIETEFQLELFIEERFAKAGIGQYRESFAHALKMEVGHAVLGESLQKPNLELVKLSHDDVYADIEVRVTDDNIDFVTVFHGQDKIDLHTTKMLEDGILKARIPLRKGLNHLQIIARDHDKLLRYLPVRYWSETGTEDHKKVAKNELNREPAVHDVARENSSDMNNDNDNDVP